ncbi:hypothetical protein, partial [Lacticaseibacillus nasuensis]|uniref:hypothetical protein n=1 Tax=Lacticaseibacillus nasuensis TaxID=944671 RepID=UPI001F350990
KPYHIYETLFSFQRTTGCLNGNFYILRVPLALVKQNCGKMFAGTSGKALMAPGCAQHNADYLINQSLAGQAFFAKKIKKGEQLAHLSRAYSGSITVWPCMYGTKTSGIVTVPSAFW